MIFCNFVDVNNGQQKSTLFWGANIALGNAIGDYGASILTDVLASNTTLTTLNADRNNILILR